MNRNDIISLDKLVVGDRFYKSGDKKKNVMAVHHVISDRVGGVQTVVICNTEHYSNVTGGPSRKEIKKPEEYAAVFLRHDIDIA